MGKIIINEPKVDTSLSNTHNPHLCVIIACLAPAKELVDAKLKGPSQLDSSKIIFMVLLDGSREQGCERKLIP